MQLGMMSEVVVGNKVVMALTDLTSKRRGSEGRGARSRAQDRDKGILPVSLRGPCRYRRLCLGFSPCLARAAAGHSDFWC
jgi:hypothetical protein